MGDAVALLRSRPGSTLALVLLTALGVGGATGTLALSASAQLQIASRFSSPSATEVTLRIEPPPDGLHRRVPAIDDAVRRISGVEHGGSVMELGTLDVRASSIDPVQRFTVSAVSPGYLDAMGADIDGQGLFSVPILRHRAVVGSGVAASLGLPGPGVDIQVDGRSFTVVGILRSAVRKPGARLSVLIPFSVQQEIEVPERSHEGLLAVHPGAATQVADRAPIALDAANPNRISAVAPIDGSALQARVSRDLVRLGLAASLFLALIGTVTIGIAASGRVVQRRFEFGLRRAIGARPRHIGFSVVLETLIVGLAGGVLGAVGALAGIAIQTALSHWTLVVDWVEVSAAVPAGVLVGLLAGIWPAVKASRISPLEALASW